MFDIKALMKKTGFSNNKKRKLIFWKTVSYVFIILFVVAMAMLLRYFLFLGGENKNIDPGKEKADRELVYTELFSGDGWKDTEATNVYHDKTTTKISFPPAYEWSRMDGLSKRLSGLDLTKAASGENGVVLAGANGKIYAFDKERTVTSISTGLNIEPGNSNLVYVPEKNIFVLSVFQSNRIITKTFEISGRGLVEQQSFRSGPVFLTDTELDDESADLSCLSDSCLFRIDSEFYYFPVNNISLFSNVDPSLDMPPRRDVTLSSAEDFWVLGVTRKQGDIYKGDIYTIFPDRMSISAGTGLSDADCSGQKDEDGRITVVSEEKRGFLMKKREGEECKTIESAFSSEYPGKIRFAFDKNKDRLMASYLAYEGQALDFKVNSEGIIPSPKDRSYYFGQRVAKEHNLEKLFYHGNGLWAGSVVKPRPFHFAGNVEEGSNSSSGRLIRIESGMETDLGEETGINKKRFEILPGFTENELFGITFDTERSVSSRDLSVKTEYKIDVYKLVDLGYKKGEVRQWTSSKINKQVEEKAFKASIEEFRGEKGNGDIEFYLNYNGGENWIPAPPGRIIDFRDHGLKPSSSADIRWRIELVAGSGEYSTPWADMVQVKYWTEKVEQTEPPQ